MAIAFRRVSFEWPNGTTVFQNLNLTLNDHRTGLVGVNGAGKSTLAHLAAKKLLPTLGEIDSGGSVHLLTQIEDERSEEPAAVRLAELEAYEHELARRLLEEVPIERPTSSFSGGEWMKFRLACLAATARGSFIILDEPTNHLDRPGREAVIEFVKSWDSGLLLVSHDRELLEYVDEILELTPQGLTKVGGGWRAYEEFRSSERGRLEKNLNDAKRTRTQSLADRAAKLATQEKRIQKGRREQLNGGIPRILAGGLKRKAQVTLGSINKATIEAASDAVTKAHAAFTAMKVDPVLAIKALETRKGQIPSEKLIAEVSGLNIRFKDGDWLWPETMTFSLRGPKRVAIRGPNGSGKSTLLSLLFRDGVRNFVDYMGDIRKGTLATAFLEQDHLSKTEASASILSLLQGESGEGAGLDEAELRNQLARSLLTKNLAEQPISSLSGGERLRAALAQALIGRSPEVLILDEPTNNLDLANIEFLEEFLVNFHGALLVVSHDERFLNSIEIENEIVLSSNS